MFLIRSKNDDEIGMPKPLAVKRQEIVDTLLLAIEKKQHMPANHLQAENEPTNKHSSVQNSMESSISAVQKFDPSEFETPISKNFDKKFQDFEESLLREFYIEPVKVIMLQVVDRYFRYSVNTDSSVAIRRQCS